MNSPISQADMKHLREVLTRLLELPRDRVGCILIVVEDTPDGMSHQRMATMGLGDKGTTVHVLKRALENVARGGASKGTLVEIKPG